MESTGWRLCTPDHFEMRVREHTHHVHKADESREPVQSWFCYVGPSIVCAEEVNKLMQSGHRPPSEGVCKTRAKNAQRFDSSTSRACKFNASLRVVALVPNLNHCEFCTPKDARALE